MGEENLNPYPGNIKQHKVEPTPVSHEVFMASLKATGKGVQHLTAELSRISQERDRMREALENFTNCFLPEPSGGSPYLNATASTLKTAYDQAIKALKGQGGENGETCR